jgi:coenzyme F420-reducing hydrogenase gamma subunit
MKARRKPKLAVWKFASCDGCQLTLLDCEDELLDIAGAVEIANFVEASRTVVRGPYDLSLVKGAQSPRRTTRSAFTKSAAPRNGWSATRLRTASVLIANGVALFA